MEKIKESQSTTIFRKNRSPKKQNKNLISADRLPPPADIQGDVEEGNSKRPDKRCWYVSQEDKTDFEYILSTTQKFGMNLSCKESKVYIAKVQKFNIKL